jgi:hypothetical protein
MGMIGCIVTSLGAISPQSVKKLGGKLTDYLATKPNNVLMRQAFSQAGLYTGNTLAQSLNGCLIELSARLVTLLLSALLVVAGLISFWFYALWRSTNSESNVLWLIGGQACLLLAVSCIVELSLAHKDENLPQWVRRLLRAVVHLSDPLGIVAYRVVYPIVSIFTIALPRLWYRALKKIHARGWEWFFAWIGVVIVLLCGFLRIFIL